MSKANHTSSTPEVTVDMKCCAAYEVTSLAKQSGCENKPCLWTSQSITLIKFHYRPLRKQQNLHGNFKSVIIILICTVIVTMLIRIAPVLMELSEYYQKCCIIFVMIVLKIACYDNMTSHTPQT